ncbi:hypothetical protein BH708_09330 [Brachybacterium sp. P6-10-X1]|nr:hypothetical protein BH708_09330 [Brachybacterium sp. P6-10-X1]
MFLAISYGLFALCALPFWFLPGGITHPLFTPVIAVGMLAPAVASVILAKTVEKTSWRTRVGLRFRGRWRALLTWGPLALVLTLALGLLGAVLMVLRGVPGDLTGRTWLALATEQLSTAAGTEVPPAAAAAAVLATVAIGIAITTLFALGEEIGWRGWLWPALKPLGTLRASVLGGIIWSLWHLPVVLIGYNYAGQPRAAAIAMFLLPCIAMSLLYNGLTERSGGNPIPAAIAHATNNSATPMVIGLVSTAQTMDAMNPFVDNASGIVGVALMLVAAAVVVPWARLRRERRELHVSDARQGADIEAEAVGDPAVTGRDHRSPDGVPHRAT